MELYLTEITLNITPMDVAQITKKKSPTSLNTEVLWGAGKVSEDVRFDIRVLLPGDNISRFLAPICSKAAVVRQAIVSGKGRRQVRCIVDRLTEGVMSVITRS